ncbi:MAG TPA: aldolase/citrate lyase family protein [Gemmataceae bacterium]|nr:aldolase/citrate lyase family protein [Gemmataceae bacterium]
MNDFRSRVRRRDVLVGPIVTLASPEVSELFALAGFDWVWLDLEHAPLSLAAVRQHLQAVAGRAGTVVRVPWNDEVHIKQVLDLGCDGVIVPQVKTADEARRAVAAAKYPPAGVRSVGISRAHQYGLAHREYVQTANDRVTVMLQIEHVDALPHVADILAVPGVDAIVVGPYDLSASLGRPGQFAHPDVAAAIGEMAAACTARGTPWGAFAPDAASAKAHLARGATVIALGMDTILLATAARAALDEVRR